RRPGARRGRSPTGWYWTLQMTLPCGSPLGAARRRRASASDADGRARASLDATASACYRSGSLRMAGESVFHRPPRRIWGWARPPVVPGRLGACASYNDGPTPEQRRAAWEAGNVFPTNYRAEVLAYLRTYLNEPAGVREGAISEPALRPVVGGDRYVVCVRYN